MLTTHHYMQAWVNLTFAGPMLLSQLSGEMEEQLGITVIEQEFLSQVGKAGGEIRLVDLAQSLWVTKGAVTKIVDRLEERGLVTRRAFPGDRRAISVVLTDEGSEMFRASRQAITSFVKANFAERLDEDEILALGEILEKLIRSHGHWQALNARLRGKKPSRKPDSDGGHADLVRGD